MMVLLMMPAATMRQLQRVQVQLPGLKVLWTRHWCQ
jgi:hypothetical protein